MAQLKLSGCISLYNVLCLSSASILVWNFLVTQWCINAYSKYLIAINLDNYILRES